MLIHRPAAVWFVQAAEYGFAGWVEEERLDISCLEMSSEGHGYVHRGRAEANTVTRRHMKEYLHGELFDNTIRCGKLLVGIFLIGLMSDSILVALRAAV